ncbi:nucleotidyltransferase domain-containing protein [Rufibacter sediminis]|uniref:Nucleotidyltransferase domain-containing protein n=1 Tax=Rufibacter sediminis TaxID=2762756 RepID=A0ABR6VXX7_9BACT|nr:nucleotidyltransferase domain-containing protein [Rufibacter sediminis]MBC3542050.1 nucleotidyltransferase domain-containing protein [Rufibacter sediminis]
MIQIEFADRARKILETDKDVIGLAVGGSWLTNEMDEFSDLDLILVTREKISERKGAMLDYAKKLGTLLSGFTGEHVGEPRVLICLYDNPLLHVDIKFLTIAEFHSRVETPILLLDTDGQLQDALNNSTAKYPYPDYQWIEDRFWIWVHYALVKIGRGEYLEAFDFLGFLRMVVFGPLLHIKNGNLPRGVRKVERELNPEDLAQLKQTIPVYERQALLDSLQHAVALYRTLRTSLFEGINLQKETERRVMEYFEAIESRGK